MKNRVPPWIPVLASTWFETGSLVATKYVRPVAHGQSAGQSSVLASHLP